MAAPALGCGPLPDDPAPQSGKVYPIRCEATSTRQDGLSGCGGLACTCEQLPAADGGMQFGWTCPD